MPQPKNQPASASRGAKRLQEGEELFNFHLQGGILKAHWLSASLYLLPSFPAAQRLRKHQPDQRVSDLHQLCA